MPENTNIDLAIAITQLKAELDGLSAGFTTEIEDLEQEVTELKKQLKKQDEIIQQLKTVANDHHRLLHPKPGTKKVATQEVLTPQTVSQAKYPCDATKECRGHKFSEHVALHKRQVAKKEGKKN